MNKSVGRRVKGYEVYAGYYDSKEAVSYIRDLAWGFLTHNVVTFFWCEVPQPVESSRASSKATILVTVVVVTIV